MVVRDCRRTPQCPHAHSCHAHAGRAASTRPLALVFDMPVPALSINVMAGAI
jgi:hypothetical protein